MVNGCTRDIFYLNILFFIIFTWYSLGHEHVNKEAIAYTSVTITSIALLLITLYHVFTYTMSRHGIIRLMSKVIKIRKPKSFAYTDSTTVQLNYPVSVDSDDDTEQLLSSERMQPSYSGVDLILSKPPSHPTPPSINEEAKAQNIRVDSVKESSVGGSAHSDENLLNKQCKLVTLPPLRQTSTTTVEHTIAKVLPPQRCDSIESPQAHKDYQVSTTSIPSNSANDGGFVHPAEMGLDKSTSLITIEGDELSGGNVESRSELSIGVTGDSHVHTTLPASQTHSTTNVSVMQEGSMVPVTPGEVHPFAHSRDSRFTIPQVSQSTYFSVAEKTANVPFLDHQMLEVDCNGREFTNVDHDITLRIPEGAVAEGEKVHFEVGVAMYGPFIFPENTQPISPILWLCLLEEVEMKKPFQIVLPHYLSGLSRERIEYHKVGFSKANHDDIVVVDNQMCYKFQGCDAYPRFTSSGYRNYGVLVSKHCCFYCLQANQTPELATDAGYCLVRIEYSPSPQWNEIHFSAVYFLDTCLRVNPNTAKHSIPCNCLLV